jgi:hypothetical protein
LCSIIGCSTSISGLLRTCSGMSALNLAAALRILCMRLKLLVLARVRLE